MPQPTAIQTVSSRSGAEAPVKSAVKAAKDDKNAFAKLLATGDNRSLASLRDDGTPALSTADEATASADADADTGETVGEQHDSLPATTQWTQAPPSAILAIYLPRGQAETNDTNNQPSKSPRLASDPSNATPSSTQTASGDDGRIQSRGQRVEQNAGNSDDEKKRHEPTSTSEATAGALSIPAALPANPNVQPGLISSGSVTTANEPAEQQGSASTALSTADNHRGVDPRFAANAAGVTDTAPDQHAQGGALPSAGFATALGHNSGSGIAADGATNATALGANKNLNAAINGQSSPGLGATVETGSTGPSERGTSTTGSQGEDGETLSSLGSTTSVSYYSPSSSSSTSDRTAKVALASLSLQQSSPSQVNAASQDSSGAGEIAGEEIQPAAGAVALKTTIDGHDGFADAPAKDTAHQDQGSSPLPSVSPSLQTVFSATLSTDETSQTSPAQQILDGIDHAVSAANGAQSTPNSQQTPKTMTIALSPASLGTVAVELSMRNGQLSVNLHVAQASTMQALRKDNALEGLLEKAGYSVQSLSIQVTPQALQPAQAQITQTSQGFINTFSSDAGSGQQRQSQSQQGQSSDRDRDQRPGYERTQDISGSSSLYV